MRRILLLTLCLALAACGRQPAGQPESVVQVPTIAGSAVEKPALEADLDGDSRPEQVYITKDRSVRVTRGADVELAVFQVPSLMSSATVSVYDIPGRPPLVGVAWPACPYAVPDNLFFAFDRQKQAFLTDRTPDTIMYCGAYKELGDGRFDVVFRHNELYYHSVRRWQQDHFAIESSDVQLSRIEIDRLPDVLGMLAPTDLTNPDILFASADLYRQFKAKVAGNWRFANPTSPAPDALLLQVTADDKPVGHLLVAYKVEAKYKQNILVTGLQWKVPAGN